MSVGISARARFDLIEIEEYIARDNPWRAETYLEGLFAKIESIADWPRKHPVWRAEFPDYRVARHGKYLILFRLIDGVPRVERVFHSARDIASLLRED
jgi:toxin ParE1/3/4